MATVHVCENLINLKFGQKWKVGVTSINVIFKLEINGSKVPDWFSSGERVLGMPCDYKGK